MKKTFIALISMVISVSMLAGCGESSAKNTGGANAEQTSEENKKDSITIATATETAGLYVHDDAYTITSTDYIVLGNIYDTLVYMDKEGNIQPQLATNWEISEDNLTYTFELRQATFHNGDALSAEDVVFSLDQAAACGQKEMIEGYESAEVVDDTTVAIHLSQTNPVFLNGLSSRAGYIVDKSYYEEVGAEGYNDAPIGTGAYKFISRTSGDLIKLEAYDGYWGDAVAIKDVTVKVISDVNTQSIALESGEADVVINPSTSTIGMMQEGAGTTYDSCESASRSSIIFNAAPGSLSENKDFRLAIAYAIDREAVIIGALEGYAAPAQIDIAPSYTGYSDSYEYININTDLEKAKEHLDKSGYNGEEFTVLCISGTTAERALAVIQNQLQQIGVKMTITAVDTANFFSVMLSDGTDAYLRANSSSACDASSFANNYASTEYKPIWYDRLSEIDELTAQAAVEMDSTVREKMYGQISDIIVEEGYGIPLYYDMSFIAYREGLQGVKAHPQYSYKISEWAW